MENTTLGLLCGLLTLFIALSAFFASAETGIMTANRYKLRHQAKSGSKSAKRILDLLAQPDQLTGAILIGHTTVNIAAASVATIMGIKLAGKPGVALAVGIITFILLVFGEAGPKTFAARHPEGMARFAAPLLTVLLKLFYPLVWLVKLGSNLFFRFNPLAVADKGINRDEFRALVQDVFIPLQNRSMLLGVLELERITVNDIMVPRGEVQGLNIDDDVETIITQLRRTQHTRLPVFRGELNDCIGILHVRNSTRFIGKPELTKAEILQYVREPYFVPEGTTLPSQLVQFQKLRRRFGLVVDEYGDVQGIVTLEAILEEIVGEFTTSLSDSNKEILPQADGSWLIDGSCTIRDINRQLHWKLPLDGPKTLNGLVIETLETIPEFMLSLKVGGYRIEVLQMKDNAVKSARVIPPGMAV